MKRFTVFNRKGLYPTAFDANMSIKKPNTYYEACSYLVLYFCFRPALEKYLNLFYPDWKLNGWYIDKCECPFWYKPLFEDGVCPE